jgi:hypothetical protein
VFRSPSPFNEGAFSADGTRLAVFHEAGRKFVRIGPSLGEGIVWLEGSDLRNGTIEVEKRGSNVQGQSLWASRFAVSTI